MIFLDAIKLTFRRFGQFFKVLFFCLLAFVVLFGLYIAFDFGQFNVLVHSEFFENVVILIRNLFINLDMGRVLFSFENLILNIKTMFAFNALTAITTILYACFIFGLLIYALWYSLNFYLYKKTGQRTLSQDKTSTISRMLFMSFLFLIINIVYSALNITILYFVTKWLVSLTLSNWLICFIFWIMVMIGYGEKNMFLLPIFTLSIFENKSAFKALKSNFDMIKNKLVINYLNGLLLTACFILFCMFVAKLFGIIGFVIAILIVVFTKQSYGIVSYYKNKGIRYCIYKKEKILLNEMLNKQQ